MSSSSLLLSQHHHVPSPCYSENSSLSALGNITSYKRLNKIPVIKSCQIHLGSLGVSLQLKIPHYDIAPINSGLPWAAIHAQADFKASIQPEKAGNTKEFYERCNAEVAAVKLFFPDVQSEAIQICMAAWLAANCVADDILESMPLEMGILALEETIVMLQRSNEHISPTNKIARIHSLFLDFCIQHLEISENVSRELEGDICDMCQGLLDELLYRQGSVPKTLENYLQFRGRTMGIHPFFTLIRTMRRPIRSEYMAALRNLQSRVSLVLGLQNDLVGLEKDRQNGEHMNAVLVSLQEKEGANRDHQEFLLPSTIEDVCGIHNLCLSAAVEKYNEIARLNGEVQEPVHETAILAFADTHLKWCASSKRYQAKVE
ncbi:hypothetical protein MYU51_007859 [Penicillium brevicompactum]|uniref:uncharacterized protein n=1 Tax=Penicillium brevicompactum TaxID=5074 RepID=UPI002541F2FC|nr:uncharacterized protein N7506_001276 [Penicillium brevicompactum]KAJ5348023.1 hypothetical protein N7506_001276 [Penicillium brevicompactum]